MELLDLLELALTLEYPQSLIRAEQNFEVKVLLFMPALSTSDSSQYLAHWQEMNAIRGDQTISVEGLKFFVPKYVFSPDSDLTNSSRQVIGALPSIIHGSVLDVGTGCGVLAIHSALRGARVVATDYDRGALEIARANAIAHGVEDRIQFIQSDLLDKVQGKFSLVLANLPIVDAAWEGLARSVREQMRKFFSGLPTILESNGQALLPFASFGDEAAFLHALNEQNLSWTKAEERRFGVLWSLYCLREN